MTIDQMMEIAKVQTTMNGKAVKFNKGKFEVITDFETEMGGFEKVLPILFQGIIQEGQNIDRLMGMSKELSRK